MKAPFVIEAKGWDPFSCYTEKSALDLLRDFVSAQLDTGQENAGSVKQLEPRLYTDVELCEGPEPDDPEQSCFCRRKHDPDPQVEGLFQPTVIRFKQRVPLTVSVVSPPGRLLYLRSGSGGPMISWTDYDGYSIGRPSFEPDLFFVIVENDGEWLLWAPASDHEQGLAPSMRGKADDFDAAVAEVGLYCKETYGRDCGDSGGPP